MKPIICVFPKKQLSQIFIMYYFFITGMVFHVWSNKDNDNLNNFLVLISKFNQRLCSKNFGYEVTYEFVELLGYFIKVIVLKLKLHAVFLLCIKFSNINFFEV